MNKGLEIGNNGEFIQIRFNFKIWERFQIAKRLIFKKVITFKITGDEYEEINLR